MSNQLLARYADCIFWLSRYVERAENLARILDVNETFSRDSTGGQNWLSIVQLNADLERFTERYGAATVETVVPFYVNDAENPTSILNAIRGARENARTLRPLISTEMWVQLNVFHQRLSAVTADELSPGNLSRLCGEIKEACQTHTGITEGTFFRDQGWHFYQLGRYLERADQTTRLLDIKYHLLLPSLVDVGSALDLSQWQSILRSVAGYHAFRRVHASSVTPAAVAAFLLHNRSFPRSVLLCIHQASEMLTELKMRYQLRGGNDAAEGLDHLRALLTGISIQEILKTGLHEFIDQIQLLLSEITAAISQAFFNRAVLSSGAASVQIQTQS